MQSGAHVVRVSAIELDNEGNVDMYRSTLALRTRGKYGGAGGYGFISCGHAKFGQPAGEGGIIQSRVTGYNNRIRRTGDARKRYEVRMRYYRPTNPRSPAQTAQRNKLGAAWQAWRELAPVEKNKYIKKGKQTNRMPHAIFISWYLKNN